MVTKDTGQRGRFINPLNLIRANAGLPVLAIALIGFTVMTFGSGAVQKIGSLVAGMYCGILVFGYLIDPKYLTEDGLKKGAGVRDSNEAGSNGGNG